MRLLTFWIFGAGVGHSLQKKKRKQKKVNDTDTYENPPLIDLSLWTKSASRIPKVPMGVRVLGSGLQLKLDVPPASPCLSRPRSGDLLTRTCLCFLGHQISLQSKVTFNSQFYAFLFLVERLISRACSTCVFQYDESLVWLAAGGSNMSVHPDFCRLRY